MNKKKKKTENFENVGQSRIPYLVGNIYGQNVFVYLHLGTFENDIVFFQITLQLRSIFFWLNTYKFFFIVSFFLTTLNKINYPIH